MNLASEHFVSPANQVRKVLLVEDNTDDERLAKRAFEFCNLPIEVEVAHDGVEVLNMLGLEGSIEDEPDLPDLVVCDLKLPKVKGDEVLDRVRNDKRLADLPFVMFSSSDEKADIDRCMSLGATAYCVKPIDYGMYMNCIEDIVRNYVPAFPAKSEPNCLIASTSS